MQKYRPESTKDQEAMTLKVKSLLSQAVTQDKQGIKYTAPPQLSEHILNNSQFDGFSSMISNDVNQTQSYQANTPTYNQMKKQGQVPKPEFGTRISPKSKQQKQSITMQNQNEKTQVVKLDLKEQSSVEKTVRNKGPVATLSSRQNLKESKSQSKVIKIETPEESRLATDAYTQIGLPSFYKLDKLSYNRSEIADLGVKISKKLQMYEQFLEYERIKNASIDKDRNELKLQLEQLTAQAGQQRQSEQQHQNYVNKHNIVVQRLEECLHALKESMIQNFVHISFYKDIQMYVSENYFDEEESTKVKSKHVQEINRIIADNKISQMQMDTDLLEKVRDDTADFLRMLHQEQEMDECVKRTFTLDLNKSCGDAESNIKVRVQRPRSNLKTGLDEAGHALMAHAHQNNRENASPLNRSANGSFINDKPHWDKHHANCLQDNSSMLKAEMHARMLQNVKLKEERDLLKRKIIELRSEMLKIKEKTWKKQHVEELREKVKKYELQINSQENRSKNINIEVVALREENMHLQTKIKNTQETLKAEEGFKLEYKNALESAQHFQDLRDAVNQVTGMLVSKKSQDLTSQQKASLQIIFGDSSVLHTLRTRLAESEAYAKVITRFLTEIIKICITFKGKIVHCWRLIQQLAGGFSQVQEEEIHNIHLLLLKNLVNENLCDEKLLLFEAQTDTEFAMLFQLQREMSHQSLLEEISKQVSDPNEKINLHELIQINSSAALSSPQNRSTMRARSYQKSQSFTLANVTSAQSSKYYGQANLKMPTPANKRNDFYLSSGVALKKKQQASILSPTNDSFLVAAQIAALDSNLLNIETEQEEASAQEIKHFELVNPADSPLKKQANKESISQFISDLILEEPQEQEQTPARSIVDDQEHIAINMNSEEDSFLEFIKEKPQIGQSPQITIKGRYQKPTQNNFKMILSDQSLFASSRDSQGAQKQTSQPITNPASKRITDRSQERELKKELLSLPEMQGLFKGGESSDEDKKKQVRNQKKSPSKKVGGDTASNFTRSSQKSLRKKRSSAVKEEHVNQLMHENQLLKQAMSQFQDKYNRMMGSTEESKNYKQ